jgi:hypothetical protein
MVVENLVGGGKKVINNLNSGETDETFKHSKRIR